MLAAEAKARFGEELLVTTSLAGRTQSGPVLAGDVRRGGFGGTDGLAAYLQEAAIDLVVDATHPFATRISAAASAACGALGVPLLMLTRPAWTPRQGDQWIEASDAAEAASLVERLGRRAFLTIGHSKLAVFSALVGVHFLVRLVDPPDLPLPLTSYEVILGRGPFTVEAERSIMTRHAIDVLVAKASGGVSTVAKLDAARALSIPVVMLRRPSAAPGYGVARIEDALLWIERRLERFEEVAR